MKLTFASAALCLFAASGMAQSVTGRWDGVIKFDEFEIPFPIEFSGQGSQVRGSFFNGDERVTSTSGTLDGNSVVLQFDHYATKLEATLTDGVLKGQYGGKRSGIHAFEARPHRASPVASATGPEIAGVWDIPIESPKGEHAWRFIVRQAGAEVSAAILRVDGDTGAFRGTFQDGRFLLSHFDGARGGILEIVPKQDGTLGLALKSGRGGVKDYTAVRPAEARAKGIPEPTDPQAHTRLKDPNEALQFSFPGLDGKLVSNTDAKFKNKVLIVNVTGSWCPNCHDEAPLLAELYRKYRSLGLEIVALDFEEAEQLQDKARLQSFIKKYGIEYTYLVAGEPSQLQAKIPQAENLNSWPTTFFVGRDGKVRSVHAGFAAAASGEFHTSLKREITRTVEELLAEGNKTTQTRETGAELASK